MDANRDKKLSSDEITKALSSSEKSPDRVKILKTELDKCKGDVSLKTFKEIAHQTSIATGERVRWANSLNFSGRLARLLEVGEPFDEMSGVKLVTEADIEKLLETFVDEVRHVVREELNILKVKSSESAQLRPESLGSKFAGVTCL